MQEFLIRVLPNVMKDLNILGRSIVETLEMTLRAGLISFILGMLFNKVWKDTKK